MAKPKLDVVAPATTPTPEAPVAVETVAAPVAVETAPPEAPVAPPAKSAEQIAADAARKFKSNAVVAFDEIVDGQMQWTFRTCGQLRLDHNAVSAAVQKWAIIHGLKQKCGDVMAKDAGTSEAEKFAAMRDEIARLSAPDATWNAGTRKVAVVVDTFKLDLIAAMAESTTTLPDGRVVPMGEAVAAKYVESRNEAQRVALSGMAKYAEAFQRIRAARFAAVDVAAMEAELAALTPKE